MKRELGKRWLIKVITGVRRCGKSSLMQLIAKELIESGVNEKNIIYLNLDGIYIIPINLFRN